MADYWCGQDSVYVGVVECRGEYFKDGMESCILASGHHISQYGWFGLGRFKFTILKYSTSFNTKGPFLFTSDALFYKTWQGGIDAISQWGIFHEVLPHHTWWVNATADRPEKIHNWWRRVIRQTRSDLPSLQTIPRLPRFRFHLARKSRQTAVIHLDSPVDTTVVYRVIHQQNVEARPGSSFYEKYRWDLQRGMNAVQFPWGDQWGWATVLFYFQGQKNILYIDPKHYEPTPNR